MIANAWDAAIAAGELRGAELRKAALALLYTKARHRALIARAQADLATEQQVVVTARAKSPELGLVAASRLRRAQRRIEDLQEELAELDAQIEEAAMAMHEVRRTLDDLRTERLHAIAAQAHADAMQLEPAFDEELDDARDELVRLRALTALG